MTAEYCLRSLFFHNAVACNSYLKYLLIYLFCSLQLYFPDFGTATAAQGTGQLSLFEGNRLKKNDGRKKRFHEKKKLNRTADGRLCPVQQWPITLDICDFCAANGFLLTA